jgi:glyoxylate/hydroxypyruvate reductase A
MRVLVFRGDGQIEGLVQALRHALPQADVFGWKEGDAPAACDYAVVWGPTPALLQQLGQAKAIFLTGAGVDAILKHGDALPDVPLIRLGDAGMAIQMAEYVTYGVLRYYRRFDEYEDLARSCTWDPRPQSDRNRFTIGVMGMGKLGMRVVEALRHFGFPVRGWTRTPKDVPGVECYSGMDQLEPFLRGTRVLVCLLPLTPETTGLLNRDRLFNLPQGAFLINVARGAIVVEQDLLELVRRDHIRGATLDVFEEEPLRPEHPFWCEPRITVTPHISAMTMLDEGVRQIAIKIEALELGQPVDDVVDRNLGY